MEKIIILGAGRGQINLINICKQYGLYVIAVSPDGPYPGLKVADEIFYCDIKEKEIILDFVQKLNDVVGIATDQLDEAVSTVAYIAEKSSLRGITTDVALKFTNKYNMRKCAEKAGVAVPISFEANNIEEAEKACGKIGFPVMIKPIDSAASRGVYKVGTLLDLQKSFPISQSYSKTGSVIVEKFITGKEYVVDAYTHDYTPTPLIVGHRDYFNVPDTFIPNATIFVDANSANSHIEELLKEANEKIIKCFGLRFGITHGEYFYNEEEDKVYLIEIAARGGGVFISSDLIPLACGVNANELLIRDVIGLPIDEIVLKHGASAYFCCLTPEEGVVKEIEGLEEAKNIQGVSKVYFDTLKVGMKTKSPKNKASRKGPILVYGETKQECYDIIESVKKVVSVKIITQKNEIKDVIW